MSKDLKKVLITGAALLMFASVGAGANSINVNARHVRFHRITEVNRYRIGVKKQNNSRKRTKKNKKNFKKGKHNYNKVKYNKRTHRNKRRIRKHAKRNTKRNKQNTIASKNRRNKKQIAKHLAKKSRRKVRRNKKAKQNNRVLKAHYVRSNNRRLLNQSGFVDLNKLESTAPEIISKYAPNSHRAVIPKKLNVNKDYWLQGQFPEQNVTIYQYVPTRHGWIKFGTM